MQVSADIASSGQPTEEQFKFIAQQHYNVVINLAMPDSTNAIAEEGSIVAALGLHYEHIPVPFNAPASHHLKTFFDTMEAYVGQKIWVHCALNYRASAFLYLYQRCVKGNTHEQAKTVMLPTWKPDKVWSEFMRQPIGEL